CLTYLAFFSQQSGMIVRNLLPIVPFLVLAAARGITLTADRLSRNLKFGVYAFVGTLVAVNFGWEVYAARQIKWRNHPEYFLQRFGEYVENTPKDTFLVSAKLFDALRSQTSLRANIVTEAKVPHSKIAFFQTEGPDVRWETWPSNMWGLYEKVF